MNELLMSTQSSVRSPAASFPSGPGAHGCPPPGVDTAGPGGPLLIPQDVITTTKELRGEDVEKLETSYPCTLLGAHSGGSAPVEPVWQFLKKLT